MNKIKKEYKVIALVVILLILIDQILKIIIINSNMVFQQGILNINVIKNTNGTYGINNNSTIMYVITNLIVICIAFKFILSQNQFIDKKTKIFLSLIIAGGISNTIDRIFRGCVVEFVRIAKLPVFNFADICIVIGWISMIAIFTKFTANELKNKKKE